MHFVTVLALLVIFTQCKSERSLLLSFCKDTSEGKWRDEVREMFAITKVGIAELYCNDVLDTDVVMGTLVEGQYEQIVKPPDQHINVYLANLLRMVSSSVIVTVDDADKIQETLKKDTNTLVAFIRLKDSIEHQVFQQVALSIQVPDDLHIIVIHDAKLLTKYGTTENTDSNFVVWFVKNDKWIELEVPAIGGEVTTEQAHFKIISYIKHLNLPLIYSYEGDDFVDVYDDSNLNFLLIFHETNQTKEITETIVEPLSKEFQLYYAFILIDCKRFPEMLERFHLQANTTLPLLVSLKNKQRRGINIESDKVSYTDLDSLKEILHLIRKDNPEVLSAESDGEESNETISELPAEETSQAEKEHSHSEL